MVHCSQVIYQFETLCRPDCWHVINLPSTCHPKCQLLWRGPSCCYRPHGSDSQRKHGQARLRSDVRQRRATGKPCSQVLTQRYRDNSWHRFGAWERRWNQRSKGNSSDCLFYSWVAGSLNGPKPFKRRPRNEAWSSNGHGMVSLKKEAEWPRVGYSSLFCYTSGCHGLGHFSRIIISNTHGDDKKFLPQFLPNAAILGFVFPSCTACLLLFASILPGCSFQWELGSSRVYIERVRFTLHIENTPISQFVDFMTYKDKDFFPLTINRPSRSFLTRCWCSRFLSAFRCLGGLQFFSSSLGGRPLPGAGRPSRGRGTGPKRTIGVGGHTEEGASAETRQSGGKGHGSEGSERSTRSEGSEGSEGSAGRG